MKAVGPFKTCSVLLLVLQIFACSSDSPAPQQPPLAVQSAAADATGGGSASGGALLSTGGIGSSTGGASLVTGGDVAATTGGDVAATTGGDVATTGGDVAATGGDVAATGGANPSDLPLFSFFVTSLDRMKQLSGNENGFGGNYGGLAGADSICQQIAELEGFGAKTWRAFLSVTDDGTGNPVHAKDRIGSGPWYDRNGRLISNDVAGLLNRGTGAGQGRPDGDAQAVDDMCDEFGQPLTTYGDSHDIVTGTKEDGTLATTDPMYTCNDWTSTTVLTGGGGGGFGGGTGVQMGHAWPAGSGYNWIQAHTEGSCAPGVNLVQTGPGDGSSIGAGGGWGGIYCFALTP